MTFRHNIFNPDGTLRGVYYLEACGKRSEGLNVRLTAKGVGTVSTCFSVENTDWPVAWARAVGALADFWGVARGSDTHLAMLDSREAFMKTRGLTTHTVTIVYQQVRRNLNHAA
jgi:hypothetical protein